MYLMSSSSRRTPYGIVLSKMAAALLVRDHTNIALSPLIMLFACFFLSKRPTGQTECLIRTCDVSFVVLVSVTRFTFFNCAMFDFSVHFSRSTVKTTYFSRNAAASFPHKRTNRSEAMTDLQVWRLAFSLTKLVAGTIFMFVFIDHSG